MRKNITIIVLAAAAATAACGCSAVSRTASSGVAPMQVAKDAVCIDSVSADLQRYIPKVMEEWKIPGMGVALSKGGKTLFCKGFGVKELKGVGEYGDKADRIYTVSASNHSLGDDTGGSRSDSVDAHTLFQVGSTSKSFTSALVAQLVDEGKISWEDTVKNILPDFEMYDRWVTENLQVKDIMTHRSGLSGQWGTYIPNLGYTRDDIYQMLKLMPPGYSFRGDFQYSNIAFEIAGQIIEKVTGKSWEDNVHERIFDRLGMEDSRVGGREFAAADNAAVPHDWGFRGDSIYVVPEYGPEQALWWLTQIEPAGGVCCSISDLLKWAEFHLHNGKVPAASDSVQVISERQMDYLHRGQSIVSQTDDKIQLYAQGWYVEQTSGGRVYYHTGTTWGFTTLCFFVPRLDLAGAVLVDSETSSNPRFAMMRRAVDLLSGRPAEDYSGEWLVDWYAGNREEVAKAAEKAKEAADDAAVIPASELAAISGDYTNTPLFGNASVKVDHGTPFITVGKQGWTHPMTREKAFSYTFRSDGHEFGIVFHTAEEAPETEPSAVSFSIDWGYGEPFPDWIRAE